MPKIVKGAVTIGGQTYKAFEAYQGGPWKVVRGTLHSDPVVASGIKAGSATAALKVWLPTLALPLAITETAQALGMQVANYKHDYIHLQGPEYQVEMYYKGWGQKQGVDFERIQVSRLDGSNGRHTNLRLRAPDAQKIIKAARKALDACKAVPS